MTGRPSGGRPLEGRSKLSPQIRKEIARLQQEMGLPRQVAIRVARNEITLNRVLQEMAARDKANNLMRRHDLDRALATQVAKGKADLTRVLYQRRLSDHMAQHSERSCLEEAAKSQESLRFALHGGRVLTARIRNIQPYEVELVSEGEVQAELVHKLQFKLAWREDQDKAARRGFRWNEERRASPRPPVPRPQDRFGCSNRKLFAWMDAAQVVMLTTLEGEIVEGAISWFGRYEIGVNIRNKAEVIFFRHALAGAAEVR